MPLSNTAGAMSVTSRGKPVASSCGCTTCVSTAVIRTGTLRSLRCFSHSMNLRSTCGAERMNAANRNTEVMKLSTFRRAGHTASHPSGAAWPSIHRTAAVVRANRLASTSYAATVETATIKVKACTSGCARAVRARTK